MSVCWRGAGYVLIHKREGLRQVAHPHELCSSSTLRMGGCRVQRLGYGLVQYSPIAALAAAAAFTAFAALPTAGTADATPWGLSRQQQPRRRTDRVVR